MGRLVVFGDSIAYGKWDSMGGWVTRLRTYIDENHNLGKRTNALVFNLSIPSELVVTSKVRILEEAKNRIAEGPLIAILALGLNDSCKNNSLRGVPTPEDDFKLNYSELITSLRELGYLVLSIGNTPVNPEKSKGLKFTNEDSKRYDDLITSVCNKLNTPKLELFDTLSSKNFPSLLVDAAHPNDAGHELLFHEILQFLVHNNVINKLTNN